MNSHHTPVLLNEVLKYLDPQPGKNFIDATADGGGHSLAILKVIAPTGRLLAIEWDEELFEKLKNRLKEECPQFSKSYKLCRASFAKLEACLEKSKLGPAAGILFDFGMSSFHLEASKRGFSFLEDEPLDMRYSRDEHETAADIVNRRSTQELEKILKEFGEERFARAIARAIAAAREVRSVARTRELVEVIRGASPPQYRRTRIHFATRTFQALRIAVNRELENIAEGLEAAARIVAPGGRIAAISFHSLEDRIVKNFFRRADLKDSFSAVTKKPITPNPEEIAANPRSRSAKMRVYEKKL